MKKIVKQAAGIDVAQQELVVSLGRMYEDVSLEVYACRSFDNNQKGFKALAQWVEKLQDPSTMVHYVMEATGVYHEALAYFLHDSGCRVSVVLPSKISHYQKTLEVKTITDKTASRAIAQFALERNVELWKRPDPVYKEMRQLTREKEQLVQEQTVLKNQLHAEGAEAQPNQRSVQRIKKRLALLSKQLQEITLELRALVKQNPEPGGQVKLLTSVKGVGFVTAVTILAETNGFALIRNKRQLTSYAGLDVREKQSGTSIKGKPAISKKGNKYLRKALYMPSLTAIRHNEPLKALYQRLLQRHGIKMKAAVAVQRKLLELMYAVYKTGIPYDPNYASAAQVREAV